MHIYHEVSGELELREQMAEVKCPSDAGICVIVSEKYFLHKAVCLCADGFRRILRQPCFSEDTALAQSVTSPNGLQSPLSFSFSKL